MKRKRKLVTLLLLSFRCIITINVLWLFLTVPWVGLQCVSVVFPTVPCFSIKRLSANLTNEALNDWIMVIILAYVPYLCQYTHGDNIINFA